MTHHLNQQKFIVMYSVDAYSKEMNVIVQK